MSTEQPAAYVLALVNKTDVETYQKYAEAGYYSIQGYDPQVTVAETPEVLEGEFPGTTIIMLRFKSMEAAREWYHSPLYQAAIPLRHAAGDTRFVVMFPA
jgi:uncharacterized protein (DUF1330 family)